MKVWSMGLNIIWSEAPFGLSIYEYLFTIINIASIANIPHICLWRDWYRLYGFPWLPVTSTDSSISTQKNPFSVAHSTLNTTGSQLNKQHGPLEFVTGADYSTPVLATTVVKIYLQQYRSQKNCPGKNLLDANWIQNHYSWL